jgi:hypothetical protein
MLFSVAVAYVDPIAGFFAFLALLAASNPRNVIQMLYALDDSVQRVQRLLEERRWPALTGGDKGETGASEGVTTQRIDKEEAAVVTPTPAAPAPAPAPATVTTPRINKEESPVVTLPPPSRFDPATPRPARLAVPLGCDNNGVFRWLDFEKDALHIGLYGTSGCGKDHLLRLWFLALLRERGVQWAILDGKGDWLTPNLARLPQMLIPPAGGYGDEGQRRIVDAIATINAEAKRRFGLLLDAGVRSVEEYNQIAPEPLPLLIVLATDIIDVVDETERLLIALVSKARALGIRVIVSMQTPTGKRLEWRMNLSTLIAGALVDGSQDAPALGVRDIKALRYRPSQLPPPPAQRGLFVVRHNNEQFLVRTPALVGDFDQIVNEYNNSALLEALLAERVTTPRINKEEDCVVTVDEQTPDPARQQALGRADEVRLASESAGTEVGPSQGVTKPNATVNPVPSLSDALGRVERVVLASESLGTASVPSQSQTVPVSPSQNRSKPANLGDVGDENGLGRVEESSLASESLGTGQHPSQGFTKPNTVVASVPAHSDALELTDDEYTTLLVALVALQRIGISRERARVFGFRFRNEDWARAAQLIRETDK